MDKKELIKKIRGMEDVTSEEKAYLIELINNKKKYGLVWENKPEDVEQQLRSMLLVFSEVKERAIISEDKEAPNHILIEGDNLHALTALTYTHEGKIDVIYIDPPYNTGNKDFIYNDHYVDKEDSYRHSKWLSFMEKRLKIAHKLLADDGVIFISIDDNEQAQLKILCNEIFNQNNFLGTFIQNKLNSKNDSKNIQKNHEYIHVYVKNKRDNEIVIYEKTIKKIKVELDDKLFYKRLDPITTRALGGTLNRRPNLGHTIYYNPESKEIKAICDYNIEMARVSNDINVVYNNKNDELIKKNFELIRPPKVRGKLGAWTWSLKKINDESDSLRVIGEKGNRRVIKIQKIDSSKVYEESGTFYIDEIRIVNSRSIIEYSTNLGTETLNNILGYNYHFENPKNVQMVEYLISLKSDTKICLDFFAGSGTTLHATMELNKKDGGKRQCILITNNENNIAEEVTYERNKRVIEGYTNTKGEKIEGLTNNNLRYYKADFVPSEKTEINRRLLTARSTELLCIKEDCYLDVTKEYDISERQARVFTNGLGKYMFVIYHSRNHLEVVNKLSEVAKKIETTEKIKVYAFSTEKEIIEDDFYKIADKIEAVPLPDSIYNAYRATFRTLKLDREESDNPKLNTEE